MPSRRLNRYRHTDFCGLCLAQTRSGLYTLCCSEFDTFTEYFTLTQALSNAHDPFSDVLDDDQGGEEPRENQDTYWSEKDRSVIAPCQGLMKASAACIRKLSAAVKANGNFSTPENVAQLDDLADISKEISPG